MTHIRQRRSTTAEWALANPILRLGEIGWDTDQRLAKLGNGVTAWNALPWLPSGPTGPVGPQGPVGETPSLRGLSVTSTTIGTGSKTFTIAPAMNVAFPVGATVKAQGAAAGNYMVGVVTAATTVSVTINVTEAAGVGTFASWTLVIGAYRGLDGMMTGPASAVSGNLPAFNGTSGSTLLDSGVASSNLMLLTGTQTAAGNKNFTGLTAFGGTPAATHSITLPSTSTGEAHYKTVDQTTNYERARLAWVGNDFNIITEAGGTGVYRDLRLQSGTSAGGGPAIRFSDSMTTGNKVGLSTGINNTPDMNGVVTSGQLGAPSGTQVFSWFGPNIAQSGTAGYTAVRVDVTETSIGSGSKRLIDTVVNGVTRFTVFRNGTASTSLAGATDVAYKSLAAGDIGDRWATQADGKMWWGPGNAAPDTSLYRPATRGLASDTMLVSASGTDSALVLNTTVNQSGTAAAGVLRINVTNTAPGSGGINYLQFAKDGLENFRVGSGGSIWQDNFAASNGAIVSAKVTGDTQYRFSATVAGLMSWGSGSAAADTMFDRPPTGGLRVATTLTGSTGMPNALTIDPTINQSGTASYRGLLIYVTETATGSGAKYLADMVIGGVSRFQVTSIGYMNQRIPTSGDWAHSVFVASEGHPRYVLGANGALNFGGGTAAVDTLLFRSSPGMLYTPGGLNAEAGLWDNSNRVFSASNRPLTVGTPASATAAGVAGQQMADATYLYTCTATNTWRRVAHASW